MPIFVDYHNHPIVWQDMYHTDTMVVFTQKIMKDSKAGVVDEDGVRYFNIFMNNDGHGCCISEASDKAAVVASHERRMHHITESEVHEIVESASPVEVIKNIPAGGWGRFPDLVRYPESH